MERNIPEEVSPEDNIDKNQINLRNDMDDLIAEMHIMKDRLIELESHHTSSLSYLNRPPERK